MNRNIKDQYDNYAKNTAPDMDALWGRIEERVDNSGRNSDNKDYAPITVNKNKSSLSKWLAAAACVALVAVGARAVTREKSLVETNSKADTNYENLAPSSSSPEKTELSALSFAYSDERTYCDYDYNGDDYFVESAVLHETQFFADCTVTNVVQYSGYCEYSLKIKALYCKADTDMENGQTIRIISKTPYLLNQNGEYLIPLRETSSGVQIVFENAPQIEYTQNGEIVFHNGWTSLNENSAECIFPEENIDDFYYDRMKLTYTNNISLLLEQWQNI